MLRTVLAWAVPELSGSASGRDGAWICFFRVAWPDGKGPLDDVTGQAPVAGMLQGLLHVLIKGEAVVPMLTGAMAAAGTAAGGREARAAGRFFLSHPSEKGAGER